MMTPPAYLLPTAYSVAAINDESSWTIYRQMKAFWANRAPSEEEKSALLDQYARSLSKPYQEPLRDFLKRVCNAEHPKILDFGCANATVAYWLRDHIPGAIYLGIDPWPAFVADAKRVFPEHTFYEADAEAFQEKVMPFLPNDVTASVISGVLCFINAEIAFEVLRALKRCSRYIILRDFFGNGVGQLGAFYYLPEMPLFAHNFETYFDALGAKLIEIRSSPTETEKAGWGTALIDLRP